MRFEVPQFIEIEDKIFGPLTWKQFVYVGGGGGLAVALFFMTPFIVFVLVGLPVAGLAFLLSFYPINNRPFSIFLESVVRYVRGTKLYLWRKQGSGIYSGAARAEGPGAGFTPPTQSASLNSLARKLELKAIETK
jgi:hypothetical protein